MARGEDVSTILRLLLEEREDLVGQRTVRINQLCASLRQLGAGFDQQARPLRRVRGVRRVLALQAEGLDLVGQAHLAQAQRQATRLLGLHQYIAQLTEALTQRIHQLRPRVLELPGCSPLAAAYAAFGGTAPRLASSGANQRHRLNRLGNRRLNRSLHLIALTRRACSGAAGAPSWSAARPRAQPHAKPCVPSSATWLGWSSHPCATTSPAAAYPSS